MRAAVLLHGEAIAGIERRGDCVHTVRFRPGWWTRSARPTLGQWFEDHPDDVREYSGLPSFFAHLLPEGEALGETASRIGVDTSDHLEILCALGTDLAGAVQVIAESEADEQPLSPEVRQLEEDGLRFALAGVQRKLSLGDRDRGLTIRFHVEAVDWIAKLPGRGFRGLTRAEHACMEWARAAGITVPEVRLVPLEALADRLSVRGLPDEPVLLVRRFDRRPDGQRVHIEDFCQVLDVAWGGDGKYQGPFERVPRVLAALGDDDGVSEWLVRMVHVLASGNGDAHLKNWSLHYPDRVNGRLAPAYDLVPTVLWPALGRRLHLTLGGSDRFEEVTRDRMTGLRRVYGASLDDMLEEAIDKVTAGWTTTSDLWSAAERSTIDSHMRGVPLLRGRR